ENISSLLTRRSSPSRPSPVARRRSYHRRSYRRPSPFLGLLLLGDSPRRTGSRLHLIPPLLDERNPARHPVRSRRSQQLVREKLLHLLVDVFLIGTLARVVTLAVVRDHVRLLLEAAHGEVELDSLVPRHGPVGVVLHPHDRRGDAIEVEERGVLDEAL